MSDSAPAPLLFEPEDITLTDLPERLAGIDDPEVVRDLAARDERRTAPPIYAARLRELGVVPEPRIGWATVNPAALSGSVVVVGHGDRIAVTESNRAEIEAARFDRGGVSEPLYVLNLEPED